MRADEAPDTPQRGIYKLEKHINMDTYNDENLKKKVFAFSKRPATDFFGGESLAVYDGPGTEKCVEYWKEPRELNEVKTVRIGRDEIRAIQSAIDDQILFETDQMEDPHDVLFLDGTNYQFFFAVNGRENEMSGSNIGKCREDYEHCLHSTHAICALEKIRDILVETGVPKECFEL